MELNVSLISNKAPNLHSAISSEINTALITNKKLLLKERGNYKFIFSLETVTFHCKKKFTNYYKSYMRYFISFKLLGKYKYPLKLMKAKWKEIRNSSHFYVK